MTSEQKTGDDNVDVHAISGWIVRGLALIPILATFCTSVALMIYAAFKTLHLISSLSKSSSSEHGDYLFSAIEIVDVFLLAVVIQVVSVGLFQLYIKADTSLPPFLVVRTLDDLKSKLVGVIITMLSVTFLRHALIWDKGTDILYLGAGIALVIYALTKFFRQLQ